MLDFGISGKTAVVCASSKGLGFGCADALAAVGANLVMNARTAETLAEAADKIRERHGVSVIEVASDITTAEGRAAVLEAAGQVDILVNNAATNPYAGPMIDADLPRWEKTIDVNMTAPFLWTQMVWQKYQKDNGGVILNIASVGGLETNPMLGVYDVTKAGLIHMTKQFAAELAPQVRVNAICPGLIKTDFARMLWEGDAGDMVAQQYPLKRLGEVEDIAAAALYLAADSGSWITGQAIVLDGGGQIKF